MHFLRKISIFLMLIEKLLRNLRYGKSVTEIM